MKSHPLISVVIPAHNAEISLKRCIQSVLNQEYPRMDVIVVDDGSQDGTLDLARSFGDRVRATSQENQGQGAARNHGVRLATGELIAFLDSDDYWKPGFLDVCVNFLQSHPEAVAVNTGFTLVMHDGSQSDYPTLCEEDRSDQQPRILGDFFAFWAKYDHVRTGTCVMRADVVRAIGGQLEELRISQDLEFWGMLATNGDWGFIPQSYWVGDSRSVSKRSGFQKKYLKRRKLCPTVEQWEHRLKNEINESSLVDFERVRGRVAAGYMHAKIVGGDLEGAQHIMKKYGSTMPNSLVKKLFFSASKFGRVGWRLGRILVLLRERLK